MGGAVFGPYNMANGQKVGNGLLTTLLTLQGKAIGMDDGEIGRSFRRVSWFCRRSLLSVLKSIHSLVTAFIDYPFFLLSMVTMVGFDER